jgi:hypothetical protein
MKKYIIFFCASLLYISPVLSWPGTSGTGGGGPGFDNQVNDTPVDGGIVTVTALAIGYGVRQARKKKQDQNNDQGAV